MTERAFSAMGRPGTPRTLSAQIILSILRALIALSLPITLNTPSILITPMAPLIEKVALA